MERGWVWEFLRQVKEDHCSVALGDRDNNRWNELLTILTRVITIRRSILYSPSLFPLIPITSVPQFSGITCHHTRPRLHLAGPDHPSQRDERMSEGLADDRRGWQRGGGREGTDRRVSIFAGESADEWEGAERGGIDLHVLFGPSNLVFDR
jgi:hypothetical protein